MRTLLSIALLGTVLLSSCDSFDQVVTIDLPEHESRLVLNSRVEAGENWNVFLSKSVQINEKSSFYYSTDPNGPYNEVTIKDATIEVKADGADYAVLSHLGNGIYSSDTAPPSAGSLLEFNISAPGFESITSQDRIPDIPLILGEPTIRSIDEDGNKKTNVVFSFKDDAGLDKDYYAIFASSNLGNGESGGLAFSINNASRFAPDLDGLGDENTFWKTLVFADDFFDGQEVEIDLDIEDFQSTFHIGLVLAKVSESFFRFRRSIELQDNVDGNPFAEPVQIFSNVEGGYGVLSSSSSVSVVDQVINPIQIEDLLGTYRSTGELTWQNSDFTRGGSTNNGFLEIELLAGGQAVVRIQDLDGMRDGNTIDLVLDAEWSLDFRNLQIDLPESELADRQSIRIEFFNPEIFLNGGLLHDDGSLYSAFMGKQ